MARTTKANTTKPEATNYSERIIELMQGKGITKTELGNLMGVKKQNVPWLLQTTDVEKLLRICEHLNVSLNDIIGEQKVVQDVKGCIVYKGIVHPINSKQDIEDILNTIE